MVKKRDVVLISSSKKQFVEEVSEEMVNDMLQWLPTVAELESKDSLGKMLRIQATDHRTFFGIASNTDQGASSFYGAESTDGTTQSVGSLGWFIVLRTAEGRPLSVVRMSDLEFVAASRVQIKVQVSGISALRQIVRQQDPVN